MNVHASHPEQPNNPMYKVLIVDDDTESLRYLGSLLVEQGYQVYVADSGRLAMNIARGVQPDAILLDIVMPEWSGLDTCRALKQDTTTCGIPVIFLTGRDADMLDGFDAGGADYVLKPFDARVLLARLNVHAKLRTLSGGLEHALTERTRELRSANAGLRRLATDLALIEVRERTQLAGDLHDGPLQKLALAQLQLDGGLRSGGEDADERQEQLDAGTALLCEAIGELRSLQFELSPPVLHEQGLPAALDWLATHTRDRWGIALRCVVAPDLPAIHQEQAVILCQCARELVHNLIKHAAARTGRIELSAESDSLRVSVEDDGRGFRPLSEHASSGRIRSSYGLYRVRERLRLLGGRFDIESPDTGSRLVMRIPLAIAEHTDI
jgi:signal transduction histidine kinase